MRRLIVCFFCSRGLSDFAAARLRVTRSWCSRNCCAFSRLGSYSRPRAAASAAKLSDVSPLTREIMENRLQNIDKFTEELVGGAAMVC